VSLADLKARMGHDSVPATMIYQHALAEADQKIADTLDQRMGEARNDARSLSARVVPLAVSALSMTFVQRWDARPGSACRVELRGFEP
jgi:hypothetical protein